MKDRKLRRSTTLKDRSGHPQPPYISIPAVETVFEKRPPAVASKPSRYFDLQLYYKA